MSDDEANRLARELSELKTDFAVMQANIEYIKKSIEAKDAARARWFQMLGGGALMVLITSIGSWIIGGGLAK